MAVNLSQNLKIGILSKLGNIRLEIVSQLPKIESQVVDVLEKHELTLEDVVKPDKRNELSKLLEDYHIIVGDVRILAPFVHDLKSLLWMQSTSTGCELIFKYMRDDPKFTLTRFAGTWGQRLKMVEYVIGNMISFERNFKELYANQTSCVWDSAAKTKPYRQLSDLTICILGLGDIGTCLAKICKDFGMKVFGVVSREVPKDQTLPFVDKYYFSLDELPNILNQVDYICNILPKTPKTDNILSNDILKNCENRKTVLVNIGRGNILSDEDIIHALERKWIGGAILDVLEKEPLPETSKLWKMSNVIITPHCAAHPNSKSVARAFLENFLLFEKGKEMNHVVSWEKGY